MSLLSTATTAFDWEDHFSQWAKPPLDSEDKRCGNAVKAIRNAISNSTELKYRSTLVFTQGSYRNRVNVRQDSDVDIGVLCDEAFYYDLPKGATAATKGFTPASYHYAQFKNELEQALVKHFSRRAVTRGNKAINVRETSYHVEADVVPLFEYRNYYEGSGYRAGVSLIPDKGGRIDNFPERLLDHWPYTPLHYENGVSKNTATNRRFKSVVRVLKKLRIHMDDAGIQAAKPIPGYLIECLVWNVLDQQFTDTRWLPTVRGVLGYIWANTKTDDTCNKWCEVDNIKYLFRWQQPWTRAQAYAFVNSARTLIGMK
jgi:hypothetical protein